MAKTVFNRAPSHVAGVFATDEGILSFSASTGGNEIENISAGSYNAALIQNMQIQFSQQVSRIYELASSDTYLVRGREQGQASIQRVIGPRGVMTVFYRQFGDVCNAPQNIATVTAARKDCAPAQGGWDTKDTLTLSGCVVTDLGINVGAQDMMINESVQMMITNLSINGG